MKRVILLITQSLLLIITLISFSNKKTQIQEINNKVGFEILKRLNKEENVFFSPFSIYSAMGMAYAGAKGDTKKEFESVLGINEQNIEELKDIFKKVISSDEKTRIEIANKIWPAKTAKLNDKYVRTLEKIFDTTVEQLDYSKKKESADNKQVGIQSDKPKNKKYNIS